MTCIGISYNATRERMPENTAHPQNTIQPQDVIIIINPHFESACIGYRIEFPQSARASV